MAKKQPIKQAEKSKPQKKTAKKTKKSKKKVAKKEQKKQKKKKEQKGYNQQIERKNLPEGKKQTIYYGKGKDRSTITITAKKAD